MRRASELFGIVGKEFEPIEPVQLIEFLVQLAHENFFTALHFFWSGDEAEVDRRLLLFGGAVRRPRRGAIENESGEPGT